MATASPQIIRDTFTYATRMPLAEALCDIARTYALPANSTVMLSDGNPELLERLLIADWTRRLREEFPESVVLSGDIDLSGEWEVCVKRQERDRAGNIHLGEYRERPRAVGLHALGKVFRVSNQSAWFDLGDGRVWTPNPRYLAVPTGITVGDYTRAQSGTCKLVVGEVLRALPEAQW